MDFNLLTQTFAFTAVDVVDSYLTSDPYTLFDHREIMHLINNPQEEIILQGSDGITFKVDEAVAKHSITIKYMIKDSLASRGPILFPKVPGNILAKVIVKVRNKPCFQGPTSCKRSHTSIFDYCKRLVTQPPSGDNDVEIKAFILELVNDNKQTLFGLLVAMNYVALKGILSLARVQVLYDIKRKDPVHICWIFNITVTFS
ncbi:hypothetical protein M9H77_01690 [Catharanthus roseus]|uniref:Uncharacterized protein n=1 Tax=Catharanthus roseus TaxID=4058 RepID=A0ACC0C6P9_CATRO|nr:hypothetical protein M9H77_01690 [Catharanthus roseus]